MQLKTAVLLVVACCVARPAYAIYGVIDEGTWPKSWPKQLEPLRKQARTLEGPMAPQLHYAIRFATRKEFETAWPYILKVKSKGAPIVLVRGANFFLGEDRTAGVVIHCSALGQSKNPRPPEAPIAGVKDVRMRWMNTTYIELVVDGNIVDLNRIPLPADTPIIDQRFEDVTTD